METSDAGAPSEATARQREGLFREAAVMGLYVAIVLLAAVVALPDHGGSGRILEDDYPPLLEIIWGSAIGLALAHWFAFRLTAIGFDGGKVSREDLELAAAQIAAAAVVAVVATVPILLVDESTQGDGVAFALAIIIGIAGYQAARSTQRSRVRAIIAGVLAAFAGLAVATVKALLAGH